MRKLFSLSILILSINTLFSQPPTLDWVKGIGGSSSDIGESIIVDSLGNIYTIGRFKDTVDFNPGASQYNLVSNGDYDVFVQKLDPSGNFLWAISFGGVLMDYGFSIDVDPFGSIYLTGLFQDTVDFDSGIGSYTISSNGYYDCYICKLDNSGNLIWAKTLGSNNSDYGNNISVDNINNLYITGSFSSSVDFDPGNGIYVKSSGGLEDIFILKLDSSGNFIWVNTFGTGTIDGVAGLTIDKFNNVYTTGSYNNEDIYVNKIDSGGNSLWLKLFGGASIGYDYGSEIAIDNSGNICLVGNFGNSSDFDPGLGVFNLTSEGLRDIFIQKLDVNGNFIWAKSLGGRNFDYGATLAIDTANNIYISGNYLDTVDFDPGTGVNYLITPPGYQQAYIEKLDSAGNLLWVRSLEGTTSQTSGNSIFVDKSNTLYLTGSFYNTTDFDPENSIVNQSAIGSSDIFIFKWSQNISVGFEYLKLNGLKNIYPNPAHSILNIETNLNSLTYLAMFQLFDLTGKEILSKKIISPYTSIDISTLPKGLYLYQFSNDDKSALFGKLIVQ